MNQNFRGKELERIKESSMNAIGPDCSYAETFGFYLRDARDVSIELEFENPNTTLGDDCYTRFQLKSSEFNKIFNDETWRKKWVDEEIHEGATLNFTRRLKSGSQIGCQDNTLLFSSDKF